MLSKLIACIRKIPLIPVIGYINSFTNTTKIIKEVTETSQENPTTTTILYETGWYQSFKVFKEQRTVPNSEKIIQSYNINVGFGRLTSGTSKENEKPQEPKT